VLEIGIGGYTDPYAGGASLRMWRSYFARAQVFALDIHAHLVEEPRITVFQGSQADPDVLDAIVREAGGPFDLIIDDGSHINAHVRLTFAHLFPHLRSGGLYVIEDLETAYDPKAGGGPPGAPDTSVAMAKEWVDSVNRDYVPAGSDLPPVAALHFYPNIVFVVKA
jgi:cephalosporin hydroxylase